ncbi:hypothetical protein [Bradyrhizobium sp.]|uniref:hypothetical protein n=1 Tax=Bradyrhizobium sp. TaxID=376 RepID=UPI002734C6AD|nr:hypothetical protein [Bradyrhizobium sp.]
MAAYDPLKWYNDKADNPPWIAALAEVVARLTILGRLDDVAIAPYVLERFAMSLAGIEQLPIRPQNKAF